MFSKERKNIGKKSGGDNISVSEDQAFCSITGGRA
jgi:hypothetical protein